MALPKEMREKLRIALGIKKSGQTEVKSEGGGTSVLVSDGVTEEDLKEVTKESLIKFLEIKKSDNLDFSKLWDMTLFKVDKPVDEVDKVENISTGDGAVTTNDEQPTEASEKEQRAAAR